MQSDLEFTVDYMNEWCKVVRKYVPVKKKSYFKNRYLLPPDYYSAKRYTYLTMSMIRCADGNIFHLLHCTYMYCFIHEFYLFALQLELFLLKLNLFVLEIYLIVLELYLFRVKMYLFALGLLSIQINYNTDSCDLICKGQYFIPFCTWFYSNFT